MQNTNSVVHVSCYHLFLWHSAIYKEHARAGQTDGSVGLLLLLSKSGDLSSDPKNTHKAIQSQACDANALAMRWEAETRECPEIQGSPSLADAAANIRDSVSFKIKGLTLEVVL